MCNTVLRRFLVGVPCRLRMSMKSILRPKLLGKNN